MTDLDASIDAILADPLAYARAAPRAIGYVGFDIPEDVLAAPGLAACHLPWRTGIATPRADQWLESSFAPWSRLILEDWAEGRFDFFDAVVFTRGDDSAQRLYYYISELQRTGELGGPRALIHDIATIPSAASEARCIEALRILAAELGIGEAELREGITRANRRRQWMAAAQAGRVGPGARYERIARASLFAPVEGHAVPEADASAPRGRVLLAGAPPCGDWLHRAVDDAGWTVVAEAHAMSLMRLGDLVPEHGDPFEAAGKHAHGLPWGKRAFVDRAAWLVARARDARADAVILWLYEEEEALPWHVPAQRRALDAAAIPACVLTRRAWDGGDDAAADAQAFLKGLVA